MSAPVDPAWRTIVDPIQTSADLSARLAAQLDAALGADNGLTKAELASSLFGDDSSESRYKTTQLIAKYRRGQLELGRMYVAFHRDGDWKNAAIATADEGAEVATRDISRLQSAMNGLTNRVTFLVPHGLLTQVQLEAIEANRRAIGTSLLTPIAVPALTAPAQQP